MDKLNKPLSTKEEVIEFVKSLPEKELEFILMLKEVYPLAKEMIKKSKNETSASIA